MMSQPVWRNVRSGIFGTVHFDKVVVPILKCEKAVPTNGRMRLFAARLCCQATFKGWVRKFFRLRKKPLFSVIP